MKASATIYTDNDLSMPTVSGSLVVAETRSLEGDLQPRRIFTLTINTSLVGPEKIWRDLNNTGYYDSELLGVVILYRGENGLNQSMIPVADLS